MDVALVRWPTDEATRARLADRGEPRLLLVEPEEPPPQPRDWLEDWIRIPAPDEDIRSRIETLRRRALAHRGNVPDIDDDGVCRFADHWVSLPPVEARLMHQLVEGWRSVVSRRDLARAGWPGGDPGRNALDVHMLRLRRRIEPLGLVIRTVRSRGYLLDADRERTNGSSLVPPGVGASAS